MTSKLFRSPIFLLFAGGTLICILAAAFWWTKVYQSPYNVYWGMLENNLSTAGVTKRIIQNANGTKLDQTLTTTYGSQNAVHALTTLKTDKSMVKTETISTPERDSVRYTAIATDQRTKLGKPFDFSSVLGKWAANDVKNSSNIRDTSGLFVQTALGIMGGNLFPQANLSAEDRKDLLKRLHSEVIFETSYKDVKKTQQDGRPIFTYTVSIQPVAYVGFEKAFARHIGLKALDEVDPNKYQGEAAIKVEVSVDARSHRLVSVDYPEQDHRETYTSYGVTSAVSVPKATITGAELQSLLGKVQ